jgi:hypothetical protein
MPQREDTVSEIFLLSNIVKLNASGLRGEQMEQKEKRDETNASFKALTREMLNCMINKKAFDTILRLKNIACLQDIKSAATLSLRV